MVAGAAAPHTASLRHGSVSASEQPKTTTIATDPKPGSDANDRQLGSTYQSAAQRDARRLGQQQLGGQRTQNSLGQGVDGGRSAPAVDLAIYLVPVRCQLAGLLLQRRKHSRLPGNPHRAQPTHLLEPYRRAEPIN